MHVCRRARQAVRRLLLRCVQAAIAATAAACLINISGHVDGRDVCRDRGEAAGRACAKARAREEATMPSEVRVSPRKVDVTSETVGPGVVVERPGVSSLLMKSEYFEGTCVFAVSERQEASP